MTTMGKWKAIVPVIFALVVASAASYFLYQWLKKQTTPKEVITQQKTETEMIAVAAANVPIGTKLKTEMIKTLPYIKGSLPPGSFTDPAKLTGRVITAPLKMNEPILESRLAPDSVTTGGISALIKPGKRAVSMTGNKVLGLSGLVRPGDRVDALLTTNDPETKQRITKVVFENLPVLATGTQLVANPEGKPSPVDIYTLEVTPEVGERLIITAAQGSLQFALRNPTDTETVLTPGAAMPEMLAQFRPVEIPEEVKRELPDKPLYSVEPRQETYTRIPAAAPVRKKGETKIIKRPAGFIDEIHGDSRSESIMRGRCICN
jgi:pilus assembly protein CpaB